MSKLTNRQKQAIDTRLKIIEKATELFRDFGYDSVKVKDICEKANISVGAFYHHFHSKDSIVNDGYKEIDILLEEKIESCEFESKLEGICFILGESSEILQNLGCAFVTQAYKYILTTEYKYTLSEDRYIYKILKEFVEEAINNKEITSVLSTKEITDMILRLARGVIFDWCLNEGGYNLKERTLKDLNFILFNFKGK